jgi:hypothetical protein
MSIQSSVYICLSNNGGVHRMYIAVTKTKNYEIVTQMAGI